MERGKLSEMPVDAPSHRRVKESSLGGRMKSKLFTLSIVSLAPELGWEIFDMHDDRSSGGFAKANHFIVTRYEDGEHNIGAHFDKRWQCARPTNCPTC